MTEVEKQQVRMRVIHVGGTLEKVESKYKLLSESWLEAQKVKALKGLSQWIIFLSAFNTDMLRSNSQIRRSQSILTLVSAVFLQLMASWTLVYARYARCPFKETINHFAHFVTLPSLLQRLLVVWCFFLFSGSSKVERTLCPHSAKNHLTAFDWLTCILVVA